MEVKKYFTKENIKKIIKLIWGKDIEYTPEEHYGEVSVNKWPERRLRLRRFLIVVLIIIFLKNICFSLYWDIKTVWTDFVNRNEDMYVVELPYSTDVINGEFIDLGNEQYLFIGLGLKRNTTLFGKGLSIVNMCISLLFNPDMKVSSDISLIDLFQKIFPMNDNSAIIYNAKTNNIKKLAPPPIREISYGRVAFVRNPNNEILIVRDENIPCAHHKPKVPKPLDIFDLKTKKFKVSSKMITCDSDIKSVSYWQDESNDRQAFFVCTDNTGKLATCIFDLNNYKISKLIYPQTKKIILSRGYQLTENFYNKFSLYSRNTFYSNNQYYPEFKYPDNIYIRDQINNEWIIGPKFMVKPLILNISEDTILLADYTNNVLFNFKEKIFIKPDKELYEKTLKVFQDIKLLTDIPLRFYVDAIKLPSTYFGKNRYMFLYDRPGKDIFIYNFDEARLNKISPFKYKFTSPLKLNDHEWLFLNYDHDDKDYGKIQILKFNKNIKPIKNEKLDLIIDMLLNKI